MTHPWLHEPVIAEGGRRCEAPEGDRLCNLLPEEHAGPDRGEAIAAIRAALRERTGRAWSVTGGRGTAWGWITVTAPPSRRVGYDYLSDEDAAALAAALGLEAVHQQGVSIPSGGDYYVEFVDRAEGRAPSRVGEPYWD